MSCYVVCPIRTQRTTYTSPYGCDMEKTCPSCNKRPVCIQIDYKTPTHTNITKVKCADMRGDDKCLNR